MTNSGTSRLFIGNGYAVFEGAIPGTADHSHHALEIFIGLEGPANVICGQMVHRGKIIIMDADTVHRMPASAERKAIFILDPESAVTRSLKERYLRSRAIADPGANVDDSVLEEVFNELKAGNSRSIRLAYERLAALLIDREQPLPAPDERIRKATEYLRGLESKKAPLAAVAEKACLSEGRLVHLFKKQMGIPIRRYQLWLRLIDSIGYILDGCSLTEAAHRAEFSDYAHLSRTFTRMFGYSLIDIFKNSASIEIIAGG